MNIDTLTTELANDEEPVAIPIYDKNEEPYTGADGSPSTISVLGSDAKAYRTVMHSITKRMLKLRKRDLTPEEMERHRIEQSAAAVVAWAGWEKDGEPWPCTSENVKVLLAARHILEQVEAGIREHADFFARKSAA